MDAHTDFTASNAPILCLVCTATACGSQLIATINVRLETTLAEVRSLLVSLASGGDGGSVAVREAPANVTLQQAQHIISSPLHPFDFTETFSFVHGGGCRSYDRLHEARLCVEDVLPRYPRLGLPAMSTAPSTPGNTNPNHTLSNVAAVASLVTNLIGGSASRVCSSNCTQWVPGTTPPVVVVKHPPRHHARRVRGGNESEALRHHDGGVSEMSRAPPQKRFALAALFVAPGDRAEGGLRVERVVAERLQLQLPDPLRPLGGFGSGAGLFSASALAATYGRPFRIETWCAGVTRWNGNTEDLLGRTLLHEAAHVGNEAAVRFLLSQSYIVVDARERQSGDTPLHTAVRGNHPALVKLLLEDGGANPLLANRNRDTPLHLALQRRRAALVGLLCSRLRALKVDAAALEGEAMQNNMGYTPAALFQLYSPSLMDMCRDGATLLAIKALVHHYFFDQHEVTARDALTGQSVLHAATASGNVEIVRYVGEELKLFPLLLSTTGTRVASTRHSLLYDFRRQNPLHVAAAAGEPAGVQYLLQKLPLACLAEVDINGNTPLLLAMKKRCWRVVELLLAQCPPGTLAASAQDRHGISALHIACSLGMTRVAAVLLKHHDAVACQNSLSAAALSSSSLAASPAAASATEVLWGPHWENTALVHHGALRGRLQQLEEREARRQKQLKHRQSTGPFGQGAAVTALVAQGGGSTGASEAGGRGPVVSGTYADYSDPVAIVKATPHYVYGGGRLGYTPLRCALLYAVCGGGGSSSSSSGIARSHGLPMELLRLLCEHGALHEGTAADTRDLIFFLLTHRTDANAEAMLAWVMQQCAAAVSVLLRRDNVLLCRFCALHDDIGVRWCVETQLCDVQSRVANPLVACAAAGDVGAAAFLIQCAGADVNALTGPYSALGVALREKQVPVAQLLILCRAQLSTGDGSWSALQQATNGNLESVLRGLLGTSTVDSLEVSRVLVDTLQRLVYTSPKQRKERAQLALYLARAYDPTRSGVHPTELLHLSAAVGCFDVTRLLVDRLVALPTTIWMELLASVPAPPSRPVTLIEPTMVPLTIRAPRLLPNRVNGKGGLYHPPVPFYRVVVPAVREMLTTTLLHRVKVRDVYSFAVEAQQVDLVQTLRCELRLPPWPQPDVRGWTVMDYVMAHAAKARTPLLALFVATGVAPATRHGRRVRVVGDHDLVRAVHEAQQIQRVAAAAAALDAEEYPHQLSVISAAGHSSGEEGNDAGRAAAHAARAALEMTANTLARLVRSCSERSLALVCNILDAFLAVHQLTDFRRVPCQWLHRVVLSCAEVGRLDVLTQLREHYGVDLAQLEMNETTRGGVDAHGGVVSSPHPTALAMAVQQHHMSVFSYLLRAGCAVHARSCLTSAMAACVPLKNSLTSVITPLALAAWRQDYVCIRLLLAASPPLRAEDTTEEPGHSIGDALRGLITGAHAGMSPEQQAALTDCVRALVRAGHPLRYASSVRVAVAKGLLGVAEALVEGYGSAALLADLVVATSVVETSSDTDSDDVEDNADGDAAEVARAKTAGNVESVYRKPYKSTHLTALAYFAATPHLVPVLRSLLVEQVVDEYHLTSWRLTRFSEEVQALHRRGGRRGVRLTSAAVDFALKSGCADGAILLLSLGLIGRGVLPAPHLRKASSITVTRAPPLLCVRVAHVLQHWHKRNPFYQSYTVLHSAAELGHGDVIDALTSEIRGLHLPAPAVSGPNSKDGMEAYALAVPTTTATVTAPSLYALAATHADGWTWLPYFERVELVLDPRSLYIAARDLFALIFSGFGVSRVMDQVCRRAAQHKLLGDVFDLFEPADLSGSATRTTGDGASEDRAIPPPATRGSAVSAVFVAHQLQAQPHCFYLAGGTYLLTSVTSLTCAIAAGSFDWVQYLSVHGPSLVYHRAAAARVSTSAERIAAAREQRKLRSATGVGQRRPWRPRDAPSRRPRHRRHHCDAFLDCSGAPSCCTDAVCRMDALTLCVSLLAEAVLCRGDKGRVQTYEAILRFLLSWPAATPRKETINLLAIVAASLRRWQLLLSIMQHADRLYAAGLMADAAGVASDDRGHDHVIPTSHQNQQHGITSVQSPTPPTPPRYFFPLLPEEIPAVLAHVVGRVRHVMHAVAHWAPKEVLVEVARHCQRVDVEAAVDARGCTSTYHALQHRQPFAVETFAALRIPLGRLCRTRQKQTPLMVAAAQGRTVAVTSLIRPERLNQQDRHGRTALMLAAAHGHKAVVEVLLAAGADVSLCDAYGHTAVMLAALGGHDDLALQLVQNFCHPGDLLSSQTSVLHCAAVGGCWRAAAAAIKVAAPPQGIQLMGSRGEAVAQLVLREDGDGHTPLFLAHAFGSARVLREFLQVLFHLCGDGEDVRSLQGVLEMRSGGDGSSGSTERRLLRSDSTLERYGWLRGVVEVNAALAEKVRQAYAHSPAARGLHAGEMLYLPAAPLLHTSASLLRWCVQTRNTVGLRVLADFNVADDCGALCLAAANGCLNVVELLVELEMSDPSVPDVQSNRYAFEHAALYGHTKCAAYLLANTVMDLANVLNASSEGADNNNNNLNGDVEVTGSDEGLGRGESADGAEHNGAYGCGDGGNVKPVAPVSVFHVMAGHCGGELLIQFMEQTLRTAARSYVFPPTAASPLPGGEPSGATAEVMSRLLYRAMQRPAGPSRLTPLEYAIAMGNPAAVLRTAQVLQRLQEMAGDVGITPASPWLRYDMAGTTTLSSQHGKGGEARDGSVEELGVAEEEKRRQSFTAVNALMSTSDASAGAVYVSASFLQWVPTLSPAVRTVLFDVFGMWDVAKAAGFGSVVGATLQPPSPTAAAQGGNNKAPGSVGSPGGVASPQCFATPTPSAVAVKEVRRLRFGDVRLIGINALQCDAYCAEVLFRLFNPDHERGVLRLLLQDFPFKIRYEPESYRQCSLAVQTQLLQWLGSSLVLSVYDEPSPCGIPTESWAETTATTADDARKSDFESIEVQVIRHRSEQYVALSGTALTHSLYISSAQHALVVPEVMSSLPKALRAHRESWKAELTRMSAAATRLLRQQPHPVLQRSVVTVDWDLFSIPYAVSSVSADVERYGDVFVRLQEALRNFCEWVRGPLRSLVREVDAADLNAVVVGVRHGAATGLQVCFRYVSEERAVTQFPTSDAGMSVMTFKGDVYPSCCIEFNEVTHTDVAYACEETVGRAVAGDVALVRVHHARDKFLKAAREAMAAPRGVASLPAPTAAMADNAGTAVTTTSTASATTAATKDLEALNKSNNSISSPTAGAEPFLRFKLELEGTTLDRMPVCALERLLLEEAVSAIDAVVSPCPPVAPSPQRQHRGGEKTYDVFHSAAIVSAALVRRLKTVLVLFTTRRDAMVRLSGDKLMLCFTQHEIPSRGDIIAEVSQTLMQEECDVHRRRLTEVYDMMQQRLSTYLPQARLTIHLEAIEKLAGDKAHMLSALRLLVHQQSSWVLQRLIEGVSIGWDTDLGAVVRRHVRQVSLTLEPGTRGSCHLSPDGVFVYYCPLLCLERRPPGVLTPSSLPSWQLLSAQHVASLLLLQLSALEPQVSQFVDRKRSVACWTSAWCITRCVVPGSVVVVKVQACNLLNEPLHRGGERLRIMGEVGEAAVEDVGKGLYHLRFASPRRAGAHRLFILLHGQPIADSPLWYTVRPGPVDLARTEVVSSFDAVVIDVPFALQLRLRDGSGNRLHAAPQNLSVSTTFPESMVELQNWSLLGPSVVAVTLRVLPSVAANTALAIPLTLSLKVDADATSSSSETFTLPPFRCIDKNTYQHVCRVRQGLILDHGSPTSRQALAKNFTVKDAARPAALQSSWLYFRRSMRRVMHKKLASEAAALGGALAYRYPRSATMKKLERPSLKARRVRKTRAAALHHDGSSVSSPTSS